MSELSTETELPAKENEVSSAELNTVTEGMVTNDLTLDLQSNDMTATENLALAETSSRKTILEVTEPTHSNPLLELLRSMMGEGWNTVEPLRKALLDTMIEWQKEKIVVMSQVEQISEMNARLNTSAAEQKKDLEENKRAMKECFDESHAFRKQLEDHYLQKMRNLEDVNNNLKAQLEKRNKKVASLESRLENEKKYSQKLAANAAEMRGQIDKHKEDIERLKAEGKQVIAPQTEDKADAEKKKEKEACDRISELERLLIEEKRVNEKLRSDVAHLNETAYSKKVDRQNLDEKVRQNAALKAELKSEAVKAQAAIDEAQKMKKLLDELKNKNKELKTEIMKKDDLINTQAVQSKFAENQLKKAQESSQANAELNAALEEERKKNQNLEAKLLEMEDIVQSMTEEMSLMEQSNNKDIEVKTEDSMKEEAEQQQVVSYQEIIQQLEFQVHRQEMAILTLNQLLAKYTRDLKLEDVSGPSGV